jgi:hypothetical protein
MAIIIACHITRNIRAAPHGDSPGITIHIMGITHPPGMGMPPLIEFIPRQVSAAAAKKIAVATARAHNSSRLNIGAEAGAVATADNSSPPGACPLCVFSFMDSR